MYVVCTKKVAGTTSKKLNESDARIGRLMEENDYFGQKNNIYLKMRCFEI